MRVRALLCMGHCALPGCFIQCVLVCILLCGEWFGVAVNSVGKGSHWCLGCALPVMQREARTAGRGNPSQPGFGCILDAMLGCMEWLKVRKGLHIEVSGAACGQLMHAASSPDCQTPSDSVQDPRAFAGK